MTVRSLLSLAACASTLIAASYAQAKSTRGCVGVVEVRYVVDGKQKTERIQRDSFKGTYGGGCSAIKRINWNGGKFTGYGADVARAAACDKVLNKQKTYSRDFKTYMPQVCAKHPGKVLMVTRLVIRGNADRIRWDHGVKLNEQYACRKPVEPKPECPPEAVRRLEYEIGKVRARTAALIAAIQRRDAAAVRKYREQMVWAPDVALEILKKCRVKDK